MTQPARAGRRPAQLLTAAGLAVILVATLWPLPGQAWQSSNTPFFCLVCGGVGLTDVILNVGLFVPFGVGLGLWTRRLPLVVAAAFAVTFCVEGAQYLWIPGRDSSLSDLITNTLGGTLGGWLTLGGASLVVPRRASARVLAVSAGLVRLGALLAAAWVLQQPSPPRPIYGQIGHQYPDRVRFPGEVLAARWNGVPLVDGELGDGLVDHADAGSTLRLDVYAHAGTTLPAADAQILGLAVPGVQLAELEQQDADLAFQPLTRAPRWRLRQPTVLVRGAFAVPSATVRLVGERTPRALRVRWERDGAAGETQVALSPMLGWDLLAGLPLTEGGLAPWCTLAWAFGLTLPLAWWSRLGGVPVWAPAAAVLAMDVAAPTIAGMAVGDAWSWVGTLLAFGAAVVLSRRLPSRAAANAR